MSQFDVRKIDCLIGKTLYSCEAINDGDSDCLVMKTEEATTIKFLHHQDCCETVCIESIDGDLKDLIGSPILVAEECSGSAENVDIWGVKASIENEESHTWTFYRFATAKGWVVVRWLGTSNGYYSESVDIDEEETPTDEFRDHKLNKIGIE